MTFAELQQLAEEQGARLYHLCVQLTGSRQEGEDLYQETMLRAVELCHKIDAAQNPISFLAGIAVRSWRNERRKYARRQRIAPSEPFEADEYTPADGNVEPETLLLRREETRLVRRAVAELPERLRVTVYLYYIAELSVEEIARTLHIPQGTVKSRLHNARGALQEKLQREIGGAAE